MDVQRASVGPILTTVLLTNTWTWGVMFNLFGYRLTMDCAFAGRYENYSDVCNFLNFFKIGANKKLVFSIWFYMVLTVANKINFCCSTLFGVLKLYGCKVRKLRKKR
jgi:hypothetical protein